MTRSKFLQRVESRGDYHPVKIEEPNSELNELSVAESVWYRMVNTYSTMNSSEKKNYIQWWISRVRYLFRM
jgi:hypothetical protein